MVATSVAVRIDSFSPFTCPMDLPYQLMRLRMQWSTADRINPRTAFPFVERGPRFPPANARIVQQLKR